ncbi:permease-like cell division protein FtsX [Diplocloster hominis]|uniref:permease-like cell division protein FtsX n=1 Tax=Diplocloster hominis TaxID=3079010 RepID=UPI0031BB0C66
MRLSTIVYSLKQGLKNIYRNKMFSLASIATMSACIFLFGLFFAIVMNFQSMIKDIEAGVAVTVFFKENVTEEQILEVKAKIEKRDEVSNVIYVSADEAWEIFSKDYLKDAGELAEGFEQDNPLAKAANLEVYMNDVSQQKTLVSYITSLDEVEKVNQSEITANTLSDFNMLIGYVSVTIIFILLAVAVFLISNTVTIGIAVRKEEIAIMKLIGATDFFVRAPFVVEGLLIGLIGSAIPLGIIYYLYSKLVDYVQTQFMTLARLFVFLPAEEVFHSLLPVGLILGVGIGFLGSFFTIRKHLRV